MREKSTFVAALYEALKKDLDYALEAKVGFQYPTRSQREFAIEEMRDKFLSKFVPDADPKLDATALLQFMEMNSRCEKWEPPSDLNSWDETLLGTFLKYMDDFVNVDLGPECDLSWGNIALKARCGPGASNGTRHTSFFGKMYSGPLTASSPFLHSLYCADTSLWFEETIAETIRQESFGPPVLSRGSKASFVPKNAKTSRLIAAEPSLNMFYQLGLGEILTLRLKRFFGIDLSVQPDINRCLARLGSSIDASKGDGFATIDLSSASDCISLGLIGYCVPVELQDVLLKLRSPSMEVPWGATDLDISLNMVSTMGNGFTFPLQTAIFSAIVAASVAAKDDIRQMPRAWSELHPGGCYSVFGDDIIVTTKAASATLRLLELLGFIPNPKKCFSSGSFRESCGFDFYQGFNVRPFFLRKVDTEQDLCVVFNGLVDWAARCLVPLNGTLRLLTEALPEMHYVPLWEDPSAGIRVPWSLVRGLRRDPNVQSIAYSCFVAEPSKVRFKQGGKPLSGQREHLIFNPSGLYLSVLRGECRSGTITIPNRNGKVRYRTIRRIAPSWDTPDNQILQRWFDDYPEGLASYPRRIALIMTSYPTLRRVGDLFRHLKGFFPKKSRRGRN